MISCNNSDVQTADQTSADESTVTTEATEEIKVLPDLPQIDFEGASYNIATFSVFNEDYVASEEENGDVINDAIYNRNRTIEEDYNVVISIEVSDQNPNGPAQTLMQSVSSGEGSLDLAMTNCQAAANLMVGGYITALDELEYVDLTKPWWDQRSVDELSLGEHLYYAINSLNVLADNFTSAVFFNKDMIKDLNLDNPYQMVNDNEWTFENMYTMSKVASKDTDGDGEMTDADTYGMLASYLILCDSIANCGELIIIKDENNYPKLGLNTSRSSSVSQKMLEIFYDDKNVLLVDKYSGKYNDAWQDLLYPAFKNERALFAVRAYVQYVYYFRDSEVNYGIVPRPKYDSSQEEYFSDINYHWASAVSVPIYTKDPEMTDLILEALTAESYYTVIPANYEVSIVNKQLRDEESEKMLDIIYSSRCFDYGQILGISNMKDSFTTMLKTGNFTFASDYEKDIEAAEKKISDLIENISGLE